MAAGIVGNMEQTLEQLCNALGDLPLAYHPGAEWRYSYATDVVARVTEVISGARFDEFLKDRLLGPLGMVDTGFYVPVEKQDRFTTMYSPMDVTEPMKGGLIKADDPREGSYSQPKTWLSGGGGLVSTVADYVTLLRVLINGGEWQGTRLLQPETVSLMRTNQLAEGVYVQASTLSMPGTGFGLGLAIKVTLEGDEPESAIDEYHWGGFAGTHTWMAPRAGIAGVCFTQLMPGFWHPFSHDFKRMVYEQLG
jgi:CubicO group peptidase (beta-lactamase class C family)